MAKRGEKTRCNNTWTEARYFSFIRSALRQAWMKYPVKAQALAAARRVYKGPDKRTKWEYKCNACKKWFKGKDVQVDHIKECGSFNNFREASRFIRTLFCELDNLQVLCRPCHNKKTQENK